MLYFVVAWCCCCLPALKNPAGIPALCCLQTQENYNPGENVLQPTAINRWKEPDEAVQATKIHLIILILCTSVTELLQSILEASQIKKLNALG